MENCDTVPTILLNNFERLLGVQGTALSVNINEINAIEIMFSENVSQSHTTYISGFSHFYLLPTIHLRAVPTTRFSTRSKTVCMFSQLQRGPEESSGFGLKQQPLAFPVV